MPPIPPGAATEFSRSYVLDLLGLSGRIIARPPADPNRPPWYQEHTRPEDPERTRLGLLEPRR